MSKINVLSSKVFNRIAAGEVIERPASVVKELVENSIDAGAKSITVEAEKGGISLIRVTDDGSGIEKDDMSKTILPHATSKISEADDLYNVKTLGFRGEALASIASVSKFACVSKTEREETGSRLYAEGGENVEITDFASGKGTEITVSNLFFNTPAREKFLKTEKAEESEITACMSRFILGNPNIAFKYVINGKTALQSFGDGEESAFVSVYGASVIKECFYVNYEKNGITVRGYIGKHNYTKPTRSGQAVFLNGRFIQNNTVAVAISNAYSPYLMKRQFPFYSLSVIVPTEIVDVNVHPNKIDVRFSDNRMIYSAVYGAVSKVLDGTSEALDIVSDEKDNCSKTIAVADKTLAKKREKIEDKFSYFSDEKKAKSLGYVPYKIDKKFGIISFTDPEDEEKELKAAERQKEGEKVDIFEENKEFIKSLEKNGSFMRDKPKEDFFAPRPIKEKSVEQQVIPIDRELKFVGQVLNTYLVLEDGADVYLVDQHAAHERILFDKFNLKLNDKEIEKQPILFPYVFEADYAAADFLVRNAEVFGAMGLDIEEFGGTSFRITSVPVIIADMDLKRFTDDLLADIYELKDISLKDLLKEKIASKACKSAIKSGYVLTDEDVNVIVRAVKDNPGLKCPHGRPVVCRVTRTEIDKWFKRIV